MRTKCTQTCTWTPASHWQQHFPDFILKEFFPKDILKGSRLQLCLDHHLLIEGDLFGNNGTSFPFPLQLSDRNHAGHVMIPTSIASLNTHCPPFLDDGYLTQLAWVTKTHAIMTEQEEVRRSHSVRLEPDVYNKNNMHATFILLTNWFHYQKTFSYFLLYTYGLPARDQMRKQCENASRNKYSITEHIFSYCYHTNSTVSTLTNKFCPMVWHTCSMFVLSSPFLLAWQLVREMPVPQGLLVKETGHNIILCLQETKQKSVRMRVIQKQILNVLTVET